MGSLEKVGHGETELLRLTRADDDESPVPNLTWVIANVMLGSGDSSSWPQIDSRVRWPMCRKRIHVAGKHSKSIEVRR